MYEGAFYGVLDPDFFEDLGEFPHSRFVATAKAALPGDSPVQTQGVWAAAHPPGGRGLPASGFKLHLSALPDNGPETLTRVAEFCGRLRLPFKFLRDPVLLGFFNSKRAPRGGAGKFITVYPPQSADFARLASALAEETKDLEGPYILSDRRVPGSKVVHYRYGGFAPARRLTAEGRRRPQAVLPDGQTYDDDRLPYFVLPNGMADPFPDEGDNVVVTPIVLDDRFVVHGSLAASNAGCVYSATDRLTLQQVVVKEARPFTAFWDGPVPNFDAQERLRREFRFLTELQGLGVAPTPIAIFEDWEHLFLAEERLDGPTLQQFRARPDIALLENLEDGDSVDRFFSLLVGLGASLSEKLSRIHAQGVVLGDISPGNIIVLDAASGACRFIDFEGAFRLSGVAPVWWTGRRLGFKRH